MQENIWEKEYRDPKLVTLSNEPIKSLKDFVRFLRKEVLRELKNLNILDLGCGNGKNSAYFIDQGENIEVTGIDISLKALEYAQDLLPEGLFIKQSIGTKYPFENEKFDIVLDITSSNSLNQKEREIYLDETYRVLKNDGYFFVRALCKDGDQNAKNLLKNSPGPEKDTYMIKELGLIERVFSREDFIATYSPFFEILFLKKETHYTKFNNRSYKRNFWVAYLKKVAK
jgi:SAM-dependent methyltransferase